MADESLRTVIMIVAEVFSVEQRLHKEHVFGSVCQDELLILDTSGLCGRINTSPMALTRVYQDHFRDILETIKQLFCWVILVTAAKTASG